MAGFRPVGSVPVASITSAGSGGVIYQITAAYFRFAGNVPTVGIVIPPIRATWIGAEILHPGVAAARVTTIAIEVLRSAASIATILQATWIGAEVLHVGAAAARITTVAAEALHIGQAAARVTTVALEVLRSVAISVDNPGFCSILW